MSQLEFSGLEGWTQDDHAEALRVFLTTCEALEGEDWTKAAHEVSREGARAFFEERFRPVLIEDGAPMLFTGYYEPELDGSREPSARFPVPLYRRPATMPEDRPWLTRAEIEDGALDGQRLEIAWLADPVEAFFLQVQGSGRIRLPGGEVLRLGYAGRNGHPYASVGQALLARGAVAPGDASAEAIKDWLRRHPEAGRAIMRENASFVFFRERPELPPEAGPLGALEHPVTALRSLAVDPAHVPLGAPVWIETTGAERLRRLMVAQDVGSAIKGAQRADIFFGTGEKAGERAGRVREGGRMIVLLPVHLAETLMSSPAPEAPQAVEPS